MKVLKNISTEEKGILLVKNCYSDTALICINHQQGVSKTFLIANIDNVEKVAKGKQHCAFQKQLFKMTFKNYLKIKCLKKNKFNNNRNLKF